MAAAYDTMVDALAGARERGYTTDFNIAFDKLKCSTTGICLSPSQFEIVEFHRFEGFTNPSDSSIVYFVEAKDGNMKGVLVSAYGTYADAASDEMIRKLSMHH
ncbi:hypothetical protein SAMN04488132_106124 [Sediminibacterium ginsengisoli]|uniref:Phosphoribosylpyrophosphate synthetase n=2 Tax=Sediminibacterium ginsengisoli TaxID=413434 RepID=A0A1T4PPG4_9BACT|nr:hypothetical protein SAMN04488132_106124 [Sediminibacterium ginsengisoli]